jgi:cell wall-associated NlpC family hydrolase
MGLYTNKGLVKHAEKALTLKTKYMWGGILRPIEQQYDMLFKMYGNKAGTGYSTARWNELLQLRNKGYYGVDCVGLVKSYYWSGKADGGTGSPKYGAAGFPDVNANYMYQAAKIKGKISTMPEIPGLIVYSKSHPHVGIYIGNGYTIESTLGARGDGVVKRKLDNFWEYWFECPYIEYVKKSQNTKESAKSVTLGYKAIVRSEPRKSSVKITEFKPGTKCAVVPGTETVDPETKCVYIQLAGGKEQWIVKSAIKT